MKELCSLTAESSGTSKTCIASSSSINLYLFLSCSNPFYMPTNPSVERLAQSPGSANSEPLPDFPSLPRYMTAKSAELQRYEEEKKNAWDKLKLKLERMEEIVERLSDTSQ